MARIAQVDPQHLTKQEHQRNAKTTAAAELSGQHVLAGAGITYGADDALGAEAELFVRIVANRHGCQAVARHRELLAAAQEGPNAAEAAALAEIRANPAAFCDDPRHAEDTAFLGEALEWLGLRPTVPNHRRSTRNTARPQARFGRCPSCRRKFALRVDGTLISHAERAGGPCPGKGTTPIADEKHREGGVS